jgi:hypothetical protein
MSPQIENRKIRKNRMLPAVWSAKLPIVEVVCLCGSTLPYLDVASVISSQGTAPTLVGQEEAGRCHRRPFLFRQDAISLPCQLEASMSRYIITVTGRGKTDPDAVIGYDPPLRTYFLQAFPDESDDDIALWIGTVHGEFQTLENLHSAAAALGYEFLPLPADIRAKLAVDKAAGTTRPKRKGTLADFLNRLKPPDSR